MKSWTLWVLRDNPDRNELLVVRLPGYPRVGEMIAHKGKLYKVTDVLHTEQDIVLLVRQETDISISP